MSVGFVFVLCFFFKQKTAYELLISDWSSDVCSSDLRFVKAFNLGNKNDAADARAIWLAVQQPCKAVAVKTEAQQTVLALHRMRQQLVKFRTMQTNGLSGLLTEYR